jgi:hypothetical protein
MTQHSDSGIPTLTQRAEPTATTVDQHSDVPVLTQITQLGTQFDRRRASAGHSSTENVSTTSSHPAAGPAATVLRAALQAEFEHVLNQAIEEASAQIRTRLEAELPAMIDRALNQVRPG